METDRPLTVALLARRQIASDWRRLSQPRVLVELISRDPPQSLRPSSGLETASLAFLGTSFKCPRGVCVCFCCAVALRCCGAGAIVSQTALSLFRQLSFWLLMFVCCLTDQGWSRRAIRLRSSRVSASRRRPCRFRRTSACSLLALRSNTFASFSPMRPPPHNSLLAACFSGGSRTSGCSRATSSWFSSVRCPVPL